MALNSDYMQITPLDPEIDIDQYGWKEVTSIKSMNMNTSELNPTGVYSTDIFGEIGSTDRKTKWGYITLNDTFMSPHAFYVFSRLKSAIAQDMKCGTGRYYIDSTGELVKLDNKKNTIVPENALVKTPGTGFNWLKDNWEYISWKVEKNMTKSAKINRKFLKMLKPGEVFWNKMLVMPAFYRDIDFKSNKRNVINSFYTRALRLSNIIKSTDTMVYDNDPDTPIVSIAHVKLEDLLLEIHEFFIKKVGGANGFINDYVVGKKTDYGARLVISPPNINVESYKDLEADFYHSSVPMAVAVNIFSPFIVFSLNQWIKNEYVAGRRIINFYNEETKKLDSAEIDPSYLDEFSADNIRKNLNVYKNSKLFRVSPITILGMEGKRIPITAFMKIAEDEKPALTIGDIQEFDDEYVQKHAINLSWCELLYIISVNILNGKTIDNTRYPMDTYNATYVSEMNIIPANKYTKVYFNGILYPRYPIINTNDPIEVERLFTDSMRMFGTYTDAMGADFDGDQISTQGRFSKEATKEGKDHMKSLSNVVGLNGNFIRAFPHVVEHGIFNVTYKIPKPVKKES